MFFMIVLNYIQTMLSQLFVVFGNVMRKVFHMISNMFFLKIIGFILIIGIFLKNFFEFVWEILKFTFWLFPAWFFDIPTLFSKNFYIPDKSDTKKKVGFIPFVVRYIIVIALGIMNLPKCILWYGLDTLGWILYLPFRLVFWTLDYLLSFNKKSSDKKEDDFSFTDKEHEFWNFLAEIDYFFHGPKDNWFIDNYKKPIPKPDPNSMNLGFHIIHFPNSVMETCYSISPFGLRSCPVQGIVNAFNKLMKSATMKF